MKKLILLFLLFSYSMIVHNSTIHALYIEEANPIAPYKSLIYAINMVEARVDTTTFDTLAYNQKEHAIGAFQIRDCRRLHYNKLSGKNILSDDLYDYNTSLEIFLYFARQYGNDLETIARKWNGSGPKTIEYWNKVKLYL